MKKSSDTGIALKKRKKNTLSSWLPDIAAWALIIPSAVCVFLIIIRPQILGTVWSFFRMEGFNIKEFVGFDNYIRVLKDTAFLKTFINTWMYVLWSLVVGLLAPFITAILLNEMLHLRNALRVMIYLPGIMPVVVASVLWTMIYAPDATGLLNMILVKFGIEPYIWLQDGRFTILFIIIKMTWSGMGGTAIYYFAALQGINRELYEAAVIDGAGFIQRVRVVLIPYMKGMLLLFGIKQCIGVFNLMEVPLQMTGGGPNNASMTLGLLNYKYAFQDFRPELALALGVIMLITLTIFTILYNKLDKRIQEDMM